MAWEQYSDDNDSGLPSNPNPHLTDEELKRKMAIQQAKRDRKLYNKMIKDLIRVSDDESNSYDLRKVAFDFAHDLWFTTHAIHQ